MEKLEMMEQYIAADCELSEKEIDACCTVLTAVLEEAIEKPNEKESWIRPHITIAQTMGDIAKLQLQLMNTSAVLLEAMEESEGASDQLLRTQDLLTSLEYVGQCLNRSYYGACRLVVDMSKDDEMYEASVTAAEKMVEDYLATTDSSTSREQSAP